MIFCFISLNDRPGRKVIGMGDGRELVCPVCRARQPHQSVCRRCGAELELLVKAIRSRQRARNQYLLALERGDRQQAARALEYLRWLSPSTAQALLRPPPPASGLLAHDQAAQEQTAHDLSAHDLSDHDLSDHDLSDQAQSNRDQLSEE